MWRTIALVLFAGLASALLAGTLSSCSATGSGFRRTPAAAPDAPDPLADFTGIWRGTSTSTMNAAKVYITFDIERKGNQLKGTYRCAPLNAVCRNNIQRGWLKGQTDARGFRVSMEDTSWCAFTLDEFYPPVGDGEYTCYMNGGIADQGIFEIKGPPAAPPAGGGQGKQPRT
jgi:hypothetical protein